MKRVIFALFLLCSTGHSQMWVSGYYPNWTSYPSINQIDWNTWTHVIHFGIEATLVTLPDTNNSWQRHFYFVNDRATMENRAGGPSQRQLIDSAHAHGRRCTLCLFSAGDPAVTGNNIKGLYIASPETLRVFISAVVNYAKMRGYDGVDIDWEWPGSQSGGDCWNFLIRTLRDTLNAEITPNDASRRPTLSIAAFQWVGGISTNIDYPLMNSAVDQWNIMCYDMEHSGRNVAHAPLYPQSNCGLLPPGIGYGTQGDNVVELVHQYLLKGLNKSIIGVGLPFYGYDHQGAAGMCVSPSGNNGQLHYFQHILPLYQGTNAYRYNYDSITQTPYLSWSDASGTRFISFDDSNSIAVKSAWAKSQGLGGMMVWEMDHDKYVGNRGDLTSAIAKGLNNTITPPPPATLSVSISASQPLDSLGHKMSFTAVASPSADSIQWMRNGFYVVTGFASTHTMFWTPSVIGSWTTQAIAFKNRQTATSLPITIQVNDTTHVVVPPPPAPTCDSTRYINRGIAIGVASVYVPDSGKIARNSYALGQASVVCPVCPTCPDTNLVRLRLLQSIPDSLLIPQYIKVPKPKQ